MYERHIQKELLELAQSYPVVTVTGPRQSGKTTLVRLTFPHLPYVNLEAPDMQDMVRADPRGFLNQYKEGVILDEIQRVPFLLSFLQPLVDEKKQLGKFILTGSHQLELQQAITQSLAGRTALLTLLPLSLAELEQANIKLNLDEHMLSGGYPRIFHDKQDPTKAYRNYFQTYVERDLRQLIQVKDLNQYQQFVRLCAGRIGQLLNLESIGNEIGVSANTVKSWVSILEASYIIFRLHPYHDNFGKRTIKSPKIYFYDLGLATYLLGIENTIQLSRDPLRGNLVENLVVLELLKARLNRGFDSHLYFYRDSQGHEVDILFQVGRDLVSIEVKSSQTFNSDFLKNLNQFSSVIGQRFLKGYLVYAGEQETKVKNIQLLNYVNASRAVTESL